ncbi:glycerophosphodiester phosphodiesterase family protein [Arcanobacterium phocae]|uniref:Glycerophosphoryl diester phosphodiesterase n=1 Tax=Arcanobacterium phocae TaxID=131112 RepID=A0A1H2LAL0_9ACTO|nr:glycerophosphodiester phosphodiesterase family protein [Arcanobacterium phocae]SDU77621.1 glycerophosphoryl diester phosphodiesterase [Arcanobacterium phocae]
MGQSRVWNYGTDPVMIAHRGGGLEAPENSRAAFELMRNRGFSFIETDVRSTKDGVAVILHDRKIDRVSDGHGPLNRYTWTELSRIRHHENGSFMRLDEVLREFPDTVFNIDAKESRVIKPLIGAINTVGAHDRICLASFSENRLKQLRHALPHVATSIGGAAVAKLLLASKSPAQIQQAILGTLPSRKDGVQAVQVPERMGGIRIVDEQFVDFAHSQGWAVHVWTVNDVPSASKLLSYGVDGIITDVPSTIRSGLGV